MVEMVDYFERMWNFFKPDMTILQTGDYGRKKFHEWLVEVGAQQVADPMNKKIWKYCQEHPALRLLSSWAAYAGKYPERRVAVEAQP